MRKLKLYSGIILGESQPSGLVCLDDIFVCFTLYTAKEVYHGILTEEDEIEDYLPVNNINIFSNLTLIAETTI